MKNKNTLKNLIEHMLGDYESILEYLIVCMNNDLDVPGFMTIIPHLCLYVTEGYNLLIEHKVILPDCISKQDKQLFAHCRSNGVKLYTKFKDKTYESLSRFNEEEYASFFEKVNPGKRLSFFPNINNYFICFAQGLPVGNYHLYSKRIFDMKIGSYIEDISPLISDFSYRLIGACSKIVRALDPSFDITKISSPSIQLQFQYVDINMYNNYANFSIKNNPPILMALLDILCVLNSYGKVFVIINKDLVLDLKVKYTLLFYAILSIRDIFSYCENKNLDINIPTEFKQYISILESKYIKNPLRRCCMHYNFEEDFISTDYIIEKFITKFGKPIKEVSAELSCVINELADKLQTYLIIQI